MIKICPINNLQRIKQKISESNLIKGDFILRVVYEFGVAWMGEEIKFL